jgi:hypothetical protein
LLPHCSTDLHLGYQAESRWSGCNAYDIDPYDGPKYKGAWWLGEESVVHRGLANMLEVLDWVVKQFGTTGLE